MDRSDEDTFIPAGFAIALVVLKTLRPLQGSGARTTEVDRPAGTHVPLTGFLGAGRADAAARVDLSAGQVSRRRDVAPPSAPIFLTLLAGAHADHGASPALC